MKRSFLISVLFVFCIIVQLSKPSQSAPRVSKVSGKVIKVLGKNVYAYLGIPYATPPVDELRFQEPQPIKSCNRVYEATRKPASCMQHSDQFFSEWSKRHPKNISEDCLYLNIWVPTESKERPFATMVWIYGGGFRFGSSNMDIYDGGVLASVGNVIVASFNYRLGAFGYSNFDQEKARGNMGMLDQVMALKWIHRNIEAFGGDRNKITIFGESAGSVSVAHHLISPLTRGLFKRAILQSGSNYDYFWTGDPKINKNWTMAMSKELGCNGSEWLTCMRNVDAIEISATEKVLSEKVLSFLPQKGRPYLSDNPLADIDNGKFHEVDVLIGEVKDEGSTLLASFKPELVQENNPILNKSEARSILRAFFNLLEIYSQNEVSEETLDRIVKEYLGNVSDEDYPAIVENTAKLLGQNHFSCPIYHLAEKFSAHHRQVYHYVFNHTRIKAGIKKWMGAIHFEDVFFVFGIPLVRNGDFTEDEMRFSRRIIGLWTSFAKTGKPTYDGMKEEWKPFEPEDRNSLSITLGNIRPVKAQADILQKCKFWENLNKN